MRDESSPIQAETVLPRIDPDPENLPAVDIQIVYEIIVKFGGIAAVKNGKIHSVKTHQPFRSAQPQETGMVLRNGQK